MQQKKKKEETGFEFHPEVVPYWILGILVLALILLVAIGLHSIPHTLPDK